jgi:hypothetical protein
MAQQLMLDIVLNLEDGAQLDMSSLKLSVTEFAAQVTEDNYESIRDQLKAKAVVELKGAPSSKPAEAPPVAETPKTEAVKEAPKAEAKEPEKAEAKK